ncbi:MAG: hypothetical protein QNK33_03485 [Bacteroidales bacterium]|nr:hypothetical protein [Bacteroidales bacterium]
MNRLIFSAMIVLLVSFSQLNAQTNNPLLDSFDDYLEKKNSSEFNLEWIQLGPVMNSARVESIQGVAGDPATMYCAFGSGNLWKTTDMGLSWKPIFENQAVLGIGDIAVSASDPEIIWLGSGESLKKARNFTMPGAGVYCSMDGGETWEHKGLSNTWHIGEIIIHPENPDIVYVAALGRLWSTNEERGVYMTKNGGETWEHVVYISDKIGAIDIVMAASNPDVVYASMWENNPGVSGAGSTVYSSIDGGTTWGKMAKGLPDGDKTGRIGLAVSYSDPYKVYALVDNLNKDKNKAAEVYLSLNGGESWERTHKEDFMIFPGIGWYFADIYVNPQNDNEIYTLGVRAARSIDGGKTFTNLGGNISHLNPNRATPLHLDMCEMWIDPSNPSRLLLGTDGGLYQSYNRGDSWLHHNNIPAGEFYDISVDNQVPYKVYGGTQDDASVYGPSKEWNPLFPDGWDYVWLDAWAGGDGCVTFADPDDPNIVYFSSQYGFANRKNMKDDKSTGIMPRPDRKEKLEMNYAFVTPYFLSSHNSSTMYHAGNYIFKSLNKGDTWERISGDLSKTNRKTHSTTTGAIAESPLKQGLLYAGTDGGVIWVSKNDGKKWTESLFQLPKHYIRSICPSRFKESRVYLTITGINHDDLSNYIYVSEDYGTNWELINSDLPNEIANVILEDPTNENILYAGLYRGVYISINRGQTWSLLGPELPACAISDLVIQEREMDLVAGTHGRGIYKLNLKVVHEYANAKDTLPENYLFDIPEARLPKRNDTHRDIEYSTIEKTPITFLSDIDRLVQIELSSDKDILWSKFFNAKKGLNQFRWDLILKENNSQQPYFIQYLKFPPAGSYILRIKGDNISLSRNLNIVNFGQD